LPVTGLLPKLALLKRWLGPPNSKDVKVAARFGFSAKIVSQRLWSSSRYFAAAQATFLMASCRCWLASSESASEAIFGLGLPIKALLRKWQLRRGAGDGDAS
jgi:hypothetical protein